MISALRKRSLILRGRKTSATLEDPFWDAFRKIAQEEGVTVNELAGRVDGARTTHNLSLAIRVFVLEHLKARLGMLEGMRKAA